MAAAITHIVLAQKVFPIYFSGLNLPEFLVGTSFPDIRYLGVIERDRTHVKNLSLDSLMNKNAFDAGLYFHSLVDEVREKFMVSKDIYSLCPSSKYSTQSLKLFEDELLYTEVDDWEEVCSFFNIILPSEESFGISRESIVVWHRALQEYFRAGPTKESRAAFVSNIGLPAEMSAEINLVIEILKNKSEIKGVVQEFYNSFASLLERS